MCKDGINHKNIVVNGIRVVIKKKGLTHGGIIVWRVKYYIEELYVHSFSTFKIKFVLYSSDSLRQEALVSDKSLIVQPRKQNDGASREIEQN